MNGPAVHYRRGVRETVEGERSDLLFGPCPLGTGRSHIRASFFLAALTSRKFFSKRCEQFLCFFAARKEFQPVGASHFREPPRATLDFECGKTNGL